MARKPRLHFPGACYHVILRGNSGNDIFFKRQNRSRFLLLLQEGLERYRHRIHAYCLMTNHVHLAIQVEEIPLSRIMQNVSFRYTRYINRLKKQSGHLFQGRFKALLIDADSYLLELVRYIHNNPVSAGMVDKAESYPWSSHSTYLENNPTTWLTTDWVLSQFDEQRSSAKKRYRSFMQREEEEQRQDFYKGTREGRILGDDSFVEESLAKASKTITRKVSLEQILQAVCQYYNIGHDDLLSKSRQRHISKPRAITALLVREQEHLRLIDLSRKLQRDLSGLSQAASRLENRLKSDKLLSREVEEIKKLTA